MKRVCLLAVIFLSFISKGYGQYIPLLNDSAVWRQGIRHCTDGGLPPQCDGWAYYDFSLGADTIIGQHTYKIIRDLSDLWFYAYIREDSGKVYLKYEYEKFF